MLQTLTKNYKMDLHGRLGRVVSHQDEHLGTRWWMEFYLDSKHSIFSLVSLAIGWHAMPAMGYANLLHTHDDIHLLGG
jgi:hypothetical protein